VDRMRAGCAFGRGAGICAYFGESTTGKADDAIGHGGSENGGHAHNGRLDGARIASALEDEPKANEDC